MGTLKRQSDHTRHPASIDGRLPGDRNRLLRPPGLAGPAASGDRGKRARPRRDPQPLAGDLWTVGMETITRQHASRKMHAQPCTPRTHSSTRAAHPAGKVLKVPHRIAEKPATPVGRVPQHPHQRRIGRRMRVHDRIVRRKIGHPRLVELEDRLRRPAREPQRMGVSQRVEIKRGPLVGPVSARDAGVRRMQRGRQHRTWRGLERMPDGGGHAGIVGFGRRVRQ